MNTSSIRRVCSLRLSRSIARSSTHMGRTRACVQAMRFTSALRRCARAELDARRVPNLGGPDLRKLIDFLRSMQIGICGTDSQRGEWRRASAPGKGVRADQPPTPFSTPVSKACRSRAQSVPQLARLCCSAAMHIQQKEQSCAQECLAAQASMARNCVALLAGGQDRRLCVIAYSIDSTHHLNAFQCMTLSPLRAILMYLWSGLVASRRVRFPPGSPSL